MIDDDVAAIDERLLACGADVAAAQEVQKERDAKTQKAELYYAERERLEAVMAEAEAGKPRRAVNKRASAGAPGERDGARTLRVK